ncbi:response regulator/sensory box/HDIG domain protein [Vibrio maritimus]|uniref:Response regulator/sensory box/HDIG domain protein n=1 Tax=Vibrio maritimus TaxID=990268 RepID=A0A090SZ48_9VIBR|nr:response regulator/sensory box/HDIG domain protein [Vibrio maritimus]
MSESCKLIWEVSDEIIGSDINVLWNMVHHEDIDSLAETINQSATQLKAWKCDWRIIPPKSHKVKWLRGYGNPKVTESGLVRWNSVVTDITREKEAELTEQMVLNDTIRVLISALEARDPYTAGHGKNVSVLSKKIASKLHLSAHDTAGLSLGALLHDIGKIGTPSEILTKPTKLLNEEYALIKLHSEIGGRFFEGIKFSWPIKDMIEQHHERLDGSGYPRGLKGEEIILEARIIAVADVIDSMSSHRLIALPQVCRKQ